MKTVYSQPNCPACMVLKSKLLNKNIPYEEIVIGKDITKEEFFAKYPDVRSVPFVVDDLNE